MLRDGIRIEAAANNTIGGASAAERNVISGNTAGGYGVFVTGTAATGNKISGNYIGTDAGGLTARGNAACGVGIDSAPNNIIGGSTAAERNIIAGNNQHGVVIVGATASGNKVSGNYIGTDVNGTAAIPNAISGIDLGIGVNNVLIGTNSDGVNDLAERNLISGNLNDGITFGWLPTVAPFNITVAGNYIGTDVSGTFAIPNGDSALYLSASNNRIGTNSDGVNDAAERNLLSGNRQSGVTLTSYDANGRSYISANNVVAGNYIGTQADGVSPLGNGYAGVRLIDARTRNNTSGGTLPAARNVIAFNGNSTDVAIKGGIRTFSGGPGNAFLGNAIFANTGLGIDLGTAGLTAHDPDDTDTGPNQLQNYPVLSAVSPTGVVSGSLDSTLAAAAYPVRIEFFANSTCDPSDHGEGEVFLGAITVNAPGNFTTPAFALPAGKQIVTATATDNNGNTSEFSDCCALITLNPASLANGVQGTAYNQAVVASPAGGNYTYAVTTNILPPGLSLNPATDVPVPGDYDGDGQTDLAVWHPSDGNWYVLRSSDEQYEVAAWGAGYAPYRDVPVPGDYDGDGKTDLAVFRRVNGTWLVKRSSDGQFTVKAWGLGTDVLAAADYDGDGKTDFAVCRASTWYIWQSATNSYQVTEWGANYAPYFDQAVPGDYDGDGQADLAVWRVSDQTWHIKSSSDGTVKTRVGDLPDARPVGLR